ncbi:MAG: hypothetical protein KGN36_01900 [Acidobacteriota bacterium]|nr:hypothetical protein [Acidobacteriota bacterium]
MQLYLHDSAAEFTFRILGSLRQRDLAELEGSWRTAESIINGKALAVDVSDLVFADEAARDLLLLMRNSGARIRSVSASVRDVLGDILDDAPPARGSRNFLYRACLQLRTFLRGHAPRCWSVMNLPERP